METPVVSSPARMAAATGEGGGGGGGGGAAPAGQEGGVDVDDRVARQVEHRAGEDASVGGDDDQVGLDGGEGGDRFGVAKRSGLEDIDAEALGLDFGGGGAQAAPATGAPVGLGDGESQVVAPLGQRPERRQRELGRAHEDRADLGGLHRGLRTTASPRDAPRRSAALPSRSAMARKPLEST